MDYKTHQEFFDKCGDQWLHPMQYGECFFPVTIEEMYKHFKARLMEDQVVNGPYLADVGSREEKLERLLLSCKAAMVADMSDTRIMIGCDWSRMIRAIEEAVSNV